MKSLQLKFTSVSSLVAVVLCFAIMLGTTYAWFSETAINQGNQIATGDFSISLNMFNESTSTWVDANQDNAPVFSCNDWAPLATEIKMLKVINDGSIDLSWKAALVETADASNLSDVIDVYYKLDVEAQPTNLEGFTKLGTLTECLDGRFSNALKGDLQGNKTGISSNHATKTFAIALQMQENAGNAYANKMAKFDIKVISTQVGANITPEDSTPENPAYNGTAEFHTDKATYTVGEDIILTVVGVELLDWVGWIGPNFDGNEDQIPCINLPESEVSQSRNLKEEDKFNVVPGTYEIRLIKNNGVWAEYKYKITITIQEAG